jgi:F0F1-type ATP synthase assembly protein I
MVLLPPTASRVQEHTADHVNERIRRETKKRVAQYRDADRESIDERMEELDQEWDVERTLETNFAAVVLLGVGLGFFVDKRWLLLSAVAAGFMIQHALQGWCPPLPVVRRMGVRTEAEIEEERAALRKLREKS